MGGRKRGNGEHDRAARMLAIAEQAMAPSRGRRRWLGVQLEDGEHEIYSLRRVSLVEATRTGEQGRTRYVEVGVNLPISLKFGGGHSRTAIELDAPTVVDTGGATITNRRVRFSGTRYTRLFELGELVDVRVGENEPIVYFHLRGQGRTTGLRFAEEERQAVIEHLEVAIAVSRGDGPLLVEELRRGLPSSPVRSPQRPASGPSLPLPPAGPAQPRPAMEVTARLLKRAARWSATKLAAWVDSRPRRSSAEVAGLPRRAVARTIDAVAYVILGGIVTVPFSETNAEGLSTTTGVGMLVWIAVVVAVEVGLAMTTGSLGKLWLGLVVVDAQSGRRPTAGRSIVRTCTAVALAFTVIGLVVDWAYAVSDGQRRSVHDRAARTLVTRRHAGGVRWRR